jgi:bleomycin hydrolase
MKNIFLVLLLFICSSLFSQDTIKKDKGKFIEYKPGYYQNSILKGIDDYDNAITETKAKKYFSADTAGLISPLSPEEFTKQWHNNPLSQGNSGTCWSFATTSFFESEIFRITGKKIKLSELYFVYWEYVERAKYFVKNKGDCYLGEGSEAGAFPRLMKAYGIIPDSLYSGMLEGQKVIDHEKLFEEYETYLEYVKANDLWDTTTVVSTVKGILDSYMKTPPVEFDWDGKEYTPVNFMNEYCKIIPRDYFNFMSDNKTAFNQKSELVESDNWWHSKDYYNVSVDDFMTTINDALKEGYTISICGDFSEPGIDKVKQTMIIPTFDIPYEDINDDARQMRLSNGSTTDDHCVHLIGSTEKDGEKWYLIKDSSAGAFDGKHQGYRYVREDYIKLKMMNILLYKYAAKKILDKIIK